MSCNCSILQTYPNGTFATFQPLIPIVNSRLTRKQILRQPTIDLRLLTSKRTHKHGVAEEELTVIPEAPEKGIVGQVDYLPFSHILRPHSQGLF